MRLKDWYATYCMLFGSAQLYQEWAEGEMKFCEDVARQRRKGEYAMTMIEKFRELHMYDLAARNISVEEIENSAMRTDYYKHLHPHRARRNPEAGKPR